MAKIKCRYTVAYCDFCGERRRMYHDDYWFCDSNEYCEFDAYTRPKDARPKTVNPTCEHCKVVGREFEKSVRNYEFDEEDGLTIGRTNYRIHDIDYLEIDGRVLVGNDEEADNGN